jgi:3-dehydroquinate synthetase
MQAIAQDKKAGASGPRLVLPVGYGRVEVVEGVAWEEIRRVVRGLGVKPS